MKTEEITNRFNYVKHLVGNTPMYAIEYTYKDEPRTIYAKAENLNMTGSIKDRMAFHILKRGYETGNLKPDDVLAEATSGNTGIAISAIGRALGHPVTIFMPDWMSSERINLIKSLGATIHLVSKRVFQMNLFPRSLISSFWMRLWRSMMVIQSSWHRSLPANWVWPLEFRRALIF